MQEQTSSILTREEIDTLRRRVIDGAERTVTEAEVQAVIAWAGRAMEGYLVLHAVMDGKARVTVEAGQVAIAPAWRVH
jgi:hypothetical protein